VDVVRAVRGLLPRRGPSRPRETAAEILRRARVRGELGQRGPAARRAAGRCAVHRPDRRARPVLFARPPPAGRIPPRRRVAPRPGRRVLPRQAGARRTRRATGRRRRAQPIPVGCRLPADLQGARPDTRRVCDRQQLAGRDLRPIRLLTS